MKRKNIETEIERIKKKLKRNCDCDECNIDRTRLPLLEVLTKSLSPKEAKGIIEKNKKICEEWGEYGKKTYDELSGSSAKGGVYLTSMNSCATINKFLIDFFKRKDVKLEDAKKCSGLEWHNLPNLEDNTKCKWCGKTVNELKRNKKVKK